MDTEGFQRFDEFMQYALYDPENGYYTKGPARIGKEGDFFTSVSVGNLFGRLLCRRFFGLWQATGCPQAFQIIEMGANDGRLASDILEAAPLLSEAFASSICYTIIEPLAPLREIQSRTTRGHARILDELPDSPLGKGVFFANELLDAFPVRIAEARNGKWMEKYVSSQAPRAFRSYALPHGEGPPADPGEFPEGYTTEWNDHYGAFFAKIASVITEGLYLFIDYGRSRRDYYSPSRSSGTMRTYYRHTRTDNPLLHVGEQDITTDVDFTTAAEAARSAGLVPALYLEQAHWLTSLATHWMTDLEKNPPEPSLFRKEIAQFQTLTHPQHMGLQFKVMELFKGKVHLPDLIAGRTGLEELSR